MTLKLVYFKMRALAEAPQLLLHYTGLEYQYLMSWDYYDKAWAEAKSLVPFKQLPMLVIDDQHEICQSVAIMKYVEIQAGINITNPVEAAKADAILQSAQELFFPLNPTVNFAVGDDFTNKRDEMMPALISRFEDLDRALKMNNETFFIDQTPRACEFAAFHHIDLSKKLDSKILNKFPRLEKFLEDIMSIDSIKLYLDSRPELVDVSVEPKLVIDGVPHPTGVNKT